MRREREDYLKFNERCQENANYKKLQPDSLHSWMAEIKKADNKY